MIVEEITQIGNPLLHQKTEFVTDIASKETQRIIQNLVDSMRHHDLIGIASTQIGEKLRIFVTEVRKTQYRQLPADQLRVYINPKIIWTSDNKVEIYEGCGSVAYAQLFAPIIRLEKVKVEAQDAQGNKFTFKSDGMLARVIQHEMDHLDGIEFISYIKDNRTMMSSGEYKKKMVEEKQKLSATSHNSA